MSETTSAARDEQEIAKPDPLGGGGGVVASVVAVAVVAMVSALPESVHYRAHLGWSDHDGGVAGWLMVVWCVWSKTVLLLLPGLLACLAVRRWHGRGRLGWWALWAWASALVAVTMISVGVQHLTGNRASDFVDFVLDPRTWGWSGLAWQLVLTIGSALLGVGVLVGGLVWGCVRAMRAAGRRRPVLCRRGAAVSAVAVLAASTLGVAAAQYAYGYPVLLERLWEEQPTAVAWLGIRTPRGEATRRLDTSLSAYGTEHLDTIRAARTTDRDLRLDGAPTQDVVLIVSESLRHDIVNARLMPNLTRRLDTGLYAERFYAASNRTEYGMYALLYGQHALTYDATTARREPPAWCVALRNSGYRTAALGAERIDLNGLDTVFDPGVWDEVHVDLEGAWWAHDRRLFEQAAAMLRRPAPRRRPMFVTLYLMATHFHYSYPPESERFTPAPELSIFRLRDDEHLQHVLNRYHNSVAFLDAEIDRFLDAIDLERTIVILVGDHGEAFFDDGHLGHPSSLSDAQTRVPLIMLGGGVPARRIDTLACHADVMPTLFHLLAQRPVELPGCLGRSMLDETTTRTTAMTAMLRPAGREWTLMCIGQGSRLAVNLDVRDGRMRSVGLTDAQARPLMDRALTPAEADRWRDVFMEHLGVADGRGEAKRPGVVRRDDHTARAQRPGR